MKLRTLQSLGGIAIVALVVAGCGTLRQSAPKSGVHVANSSPRSGAAKACLHSGPTVGSTTSAGPEHWQVRWIESGPSLGCVVTIERERGRECTRVHTLQTTAPVQFAGLSFISPNTGWLMVTSGPGYPANSSVYRTDDGGKSWSKLLSAAEWHNTAWGQEMFGYQMSFVNSLDGWILASSLPGAGSAPKDLLRTQDGGRHWAMIAGDLALTGYIGTDQPTVMAFSTPEVGWIAASTDATSPKPTAYLYRTGDGGRSWAPVALPVPSAGHRAWAAFRARQLTFQSAADGMLVYSFIPLGGPAVTFCYSTHDGGRQWTVDRCHG